MCIPAEVDLVDAFSKFLVQQELAVNSEKLILPCLVDLNRNNPVHGRIGQNLKITFTIGLSDCNGFGDPSRRNRTFQQLGIGEARLCRQGIPSDIVKKLEAVGLVLFGSRNTHHYTAIKWHRIFLENIGSGNGLPSLEQSAVGQVDAVVPDGIIPGRNQHQLINSKVRSTQNGQLGF